MQLESNGGTEKRLPSAGHRVQGLGHARGRDGERDESRLDGGCGGELVVDVGDHVVRVDVALALSRRPESLVAMRTQERLGS